MPSLENLIPNKKSKKNKNVKKEVDFEKKANNEISKGALIDKKPKKPKNTMNAIQIIESQIQKEKKETKQYEKSTEVNIISLKRFCI
jgi:hypothetical protein